MNQRLLISKKLSRLCFNQVNRLFVSVYNRPRKLFAIFLLLIIQQSCASTCCECPRVATASRDFADQLSASSLLLNSGDLKNVAQLLVKLHSAQDPLSHHI